MPNQIKFTINATALVNINGEKKELKIVADSFTNPTQGIISFESPVGKALLYRSIKEKVEVKLPSGKTVICEILGIKQ